MCGKHWKKRNLAQLGGKKQGENFPMEDKMKVESWWLFEHDGKLKCDRRNGRREMSIEWWLFVGEGHKALWCDRCLWPRGTSNHYYW
jgi:hypothetical protein